MFEILSNARRRDVTGVTPLDSNGLKQPPQIARGAPVKVKCLGVGLTGQGKLLFELTVKFGEQFIRVYGDTAVNTGYYTLFYTKDGETKSIPARYSFTFVKEGNDCKIVDHHSSAMPAPTR